MVVSDAGFLIVNKAMVAPGEPGRQWPVVKTPVSSAYAVPVGEKPVAGEDVGEEQGHLAR
jgi:hypothetical protein